MTHLQGGKFRGSLLNVNLNHKELYMALKALNTSMNRQGSFLKYLRLQSSSCSINSLLLRTPSHKMTQ